VQNPTTHIFAPNLIQRFCFTSKKICEKDKKERNFCAIFHYKDVEVTKKDKIMADIQDMPDEELMFLCAQDDLGAFNTLFGRYQKRILNFACRYLNDRSSAEDILQETFLRMLLFRKSFNKRKASFATWLHTISKNLCFQESQKGKIQGMPSNPSFHSRVDSAEGQDEELEVPDCHQLNPLEKLEHQELQEKVNQAISLLPSRQREALILSKYQGMSLSEIAAVLDCSEGAVKQLIHRALLSLRAKLAPYIKGSEWR